MRTFDKVCAQGDVMFVRVDELPEGLEEIQPEGNHIIVTHSETGHHHVMERADAKMYRKPDLPNEILECFITVNKPTALKHLRSFDTHAPIQFKPGNYRVRRQREYTPEGFRRVED